jgi:hypothetical protein
MFNARDKIDRETLEIFIYCNACLRNTGSASAPAVDRPCVVPCHFLTMTTQILYQPKAHGKLGVKMYFYWPIPPLSFNWTLQSEHSSFRYSIIKWNVKMIPFIPNLTVDPGKPCFWNMLHRCNIGKQRNIPWLEPHHTCKTSPIRKGFVVCCHLSYYFDTIDVARVQHW